MCLSFTLEKKNNNPRAAFVKTMTDWLRKRLLTLHSDKSSCRSHLPKSYKQSDFSPPPNQPGTATLENLHEFFFLILPLFLFFCSWYICFNPSFFFSQLLTASSVHHRGLQEQSPICKRGNTHRRPQLAKGQYPADSTRNCLRCFKIERRPLVVIFLALLQWVFSKPSV